MHQHKLSSVYLKNVDRTASLLEKHLRDLYEQKYKKEMTDEIIRKKRSSTGSSNDPSKSSDWLDDLFFGTV